MTTAHLQANGERPVVGFVGLGNIGSSMAGNLLSAGFDVVGYDPKPPPSFAAAGGRLAEDARALARQADRVVHSLASPTALSATVDALLEVARPGQTVIELSSYPLAVKSAEAARLAAHGIELLDCEVSGLPAAVRMRKAVIFKSGRSAAFDALDPIFDAMAERHFYVGPFGAATNLKLIANFMVCAHNMVAAEALTLAGRCGIDLKLMIEVFGPSAAGSSTFSAKAPLMATRQFDEGAGPFRNMFHYLERVRRLAGEVAAPMPLLEAMHPFYEQARSQGMGDRDIAALIEIVEAAAPIAPGRPNPSPP